MTTASGCTAAVAALRSQLDSLGEAPAPPPPPPLSPWVVAQRARRSVARLAKKVDAAGVAQRTASEAAERAGRALADADSHLANVSAQLREARAAEVTAVKALQSEEAAQATKVADGMQLHVSATSVDEHLRAVAIAVSAAAASVPDVSLGPKVEEALAVLRDAAQVCRGASSIPSEPTSLGGTVPRRAAWADADAVVAGDSGLEDDHWADGCTRGAAVSAMQEEAGSCKRGCPDDELLADGLRGEGQPWEQRPPRCRRSGGGASARANSEEAPSQRHSRSSRSPLRGSTVDTVRQAVGEIRVGLSCGACQPVVEPAVDRLIGALQQERAVSVTADPSTVHPVFVAASGAASGSRIHSTC